MEQYKYRYSARSKDERKEVEAIRNLYTKPEEDKMELLRRLNASVWRPGMTASLAIGIVGTLVMGTGLTCVLEWGHMILGIAVGVVGLAIAGVAYPVFKKVTDKRKEALAPEILKLSDEILNGNSEEEN